MARGSQSPGRAASGTPERTTMAVISAQFIAFGVVLGIQGVVWAEVMLRLALGEGAFGTAQLALPLMGVVVLAVNAKVYDRLGAKWQGVVSLGLLCLGMVVIAALPTVPGFVLGLVLCGIGFAALDAATNAAAMDLEQRTGRHVLNLLHGLQSLGVIVAAFLTGAALQAGWSYRWIMVVGTLVVGVPVLFASLPVRFGGVQEEDSGAGGDDPPLWRNPALVRIAAICFLGSAAEAVAVVWAVIHMRNLGAGAGVAAVAFGLFNATMLVGRFLNTGVVRTRGAGFSLVLSGLGVAAAAALLLASGSVPVGVAAFGLLGLAVAGVQPTSLSASASLARNTGAVAAAVMLSAYAALLLVPVLYGWVAEFGSTRSAMALVLAAGVLGTALALRHFAPAAEPAGREAAPPAA